MVYSVLDRATAPARRIHKRLRLMSKEAQNAMRNSARSYARAGAAITAATGLAATASLRQRGDTEDALGDLASVGVKKLGALTSAAIAFTNQWSRVGRVKFLTAAYDIKSGISSLSDEGVAGFTRLAALTGIATKATTDQMTELFAQAYNIYRKQFGSDMEFGQAFSAGLSEAVKRFRTDGKQMAGAIANVQGVASSFGVTMGEQIAVLGFMRNTFKSGEEAGTGYRTIMMRLIEAGKKLGTSFTDANGKAQPLPEIIKKIERAQAKAVKAGKGAAFQEALKKAFGEEALRALSAFMGKSDELAQHIQGVSEAMNKGEAHTSLMAQLRDEGVNRSTKRLSNSLANLASIVGRALAPVFNAAARMVTKLVVAMQKFAAKNPRLVRLIFIVVGALGALLSIVAAVKLGMLALAAASFTNPITGSLALIVIGITALIAAGVALYMYWDKIKAWFIKMWERWGATVKRFAAYILVAIGPIGWGIAGLILVVKHLYKNWRQYLAALQQKWQELKDSISGFFNWLSSLSFVRVGVNLIKGLWDGISSVWSKLTAWMSDAVNSLLGWMPDWIKERMGISTEVSGEIKTPKPDRVMDSAREAKLKSESKVRVEMDFKNVPKGAQVSKIDRYGDDNAQVLAGMNYAPGT